MKQLSRIDRIAAHRARNKKAARSPAKMKAARKARPLMVTEAHVERVRALVEETNGLYYYIGPLPRTSTQ